MRKALNIIVSYKILCFWVYFNCRLFINKYLEDQFFKYRVMLYMFLMFSFISSQMLIFFFLQGGNNWKNVRNNITKKICKKRSIFRNKMLQKCIDINVIYKIQSKIIYRAWKICNCVYFSLNTRFIRDIKRNLYAILRSRTFKKQPRSRWLKMIMHEQLCILSHENHQMLLNRFIDNK